MNVNTSIKRDERGRVAVVVVETRDRCTEYVRESGGLFRAFIGQIQADGGRAYKIETLDIDKLPDAVRYNFLH